MTQSQQLGFGFDEMLHEQETAHLPSTMEEAIPYYRKLIEKHHAAMMAGDKDAAMAVRREADELAYKLNGNDSCGIKGGPDSVAAKLERATAAPDGTAPLWGQTGDYTINVDGMKVRIEQDGIFAVGSHAMFWLAFSAHAVDWDKPFLSETGYRSFIGIFAPPEPGVTPDDFARGVITGNLQRECKGKQHRIEKSYVDREMQRRAEVSLQPDL
jgi:hypothetical protein